ncbi:TIGR04222 domain-containing membrane protein [Actinosynnema mirum]|uniref:TIGR04222 domain-containing protein n=1 Tax=Actinosynnema mirum (strain ATCC 29888 / DSM 43827 / JCM 3225 / NBRC 14064 / NCIMB 13271 / NRRL B-12336 / IMRU 3971 / 101) TaxID=446462 RepID=C6WBE3_ACTMD|nr:TIGR04222 domain-containing membrane protein [Actinosynnema mirum]ACU35511.1 hypothetical protein Amir_1562 [Actinosynnema mirum DSM 43827]
MATSAATRADGLTTEQLACLAGGPRRVVEVAVLALVRAGAVRVGRNGVVSAVSGASPRTGAQAAVLAHLGQHLGNVVEKASDSIGARAVRDELLALGLLRSPAFQERLRAARVVLVMLACLLAASLVVLPEHFVAKLALLVALLLVRYGLGFWKGMVNGRGRAVLRDAPSAIAGRVDWSERVIALVGLQGGFQGRPAHEFTVVPESAVRTMRRPRNAAKVGAATGGGAYYGGGDGGVHHADSGWSGSGWSDRSDGGGADSSGWGSDGGSDSGSDSGSGCGGGCGGGGD